MAVDSKPLVSGVPPTKSQSPPRPKRRYVPSLRVVLFVVTGLCLLGIWELVARTLLPAYVARPSGVFPAIPTVIFAKTATNGLSTTGSFWSDVLATCGAVVEGMAIGTAVGAVLGLAMGRVPQVRWFFTVYVRGLYAMPLIALVPLITLWLGYGSLARLAVVFVAAVLPVTVTTADGARDTSSNYLDVGKVFGAKTHQVWFGIALPAAVPHIMAGVQISIARAVTNAVAVEVLASVQGLGLATYSESQSFHEDEAFVYVITLALFAVVARAVILYGRKRLAPWYRSEG
ncbi:MAG: ABC transporter permease [Acidimicrobiales bacterium]